MACNTSSITKQGRSDSEPQLGAPREVDLSIIVPLYNEAENVHLLYQSLVREISVLDLDYELLFVDDGSQDNTFLVASNLASKDPRLRVIKFRKNFGQTPAMAAGIDHARGKVLVTMDGDLQNDPVDISNLLQMINQGYDIVVGWRYRRKDKLISRKIPSMIANWLIGKVTGVPIKDNGCSLKAFRADIIKSVPLYSEMHRFIPAMASIAGARIAQIKVKHHPRRFGKSKYGLSRVYKVIIDLLTIKTIVSFTARPLLWFGILATPLILASAITLSYSVYVMLLKNSPFPISIAGVGILFAALAGFLLLGGILGELIYKTGNINLNRLSLLTAKITKSTIKR